MELVSEVGGGGVRGTSAPAPRSPCARLCVYSFARVVLDRHPPDVHWMAHYPVPAQRSPNECNSGHGSAPLLSIDFLVLGVLDRPGWRMWCVVLVSPPPFPTTCSSNDEALWGHRSEH